jgi:hypothetical protein
MSSGAMYCAYHPNTETVLRCGRCGKPICTRCIVQTPVGARCRECAGVRRLPLYQLESADYLRSLGVMLGLGLAGGLAWSQAGFFAFFVALILGYFAGAGIDWAVRGRRGPVPVVMAGAPVALAYLSSPFAGLLLAALSGRAFPPGLLAGLVGAWFNPFGLLFLAIAVGVAASRMR